MSYYYSYSFVSPEPQYATVKEELKSYFDTGAIDDLMFPTYLNKCLNKLGKSGYYITNEVLEIQDYQCRLPDNFYAVREAWLCTNINALPYQSPNSFYSQAASETTIQVSPVISNGEPCTNLECTTGCPTCMPELIQAVYKTNNEVTRSYTKKYLLKPGNISVKSHCTLDCKNFGSSAPDSFDIRDNKFVVSFKEGDVYLVFYATEYDGVGNQMIPDNHRVKEYIEAFLKFKCFETLTNQVNDETFNQLNQKMGFYKSLSDEAYIIAETEIKKQDAYAKVRAIKRQKNSLNMYEIADRNNYYNRYNWRRNG